MSPENESERERAGFCLDWIHRHQSIIRTSLAALERQEWEMIEAYETL